MKSSTRRNCVPSCCFLLLALTGCGLDRTPYAADPAQTPITLCDQRWILLGKAVRTRDCNVQLTAGKPYQGGGIVWPDPLPTSDWKLSFTATISNTSSTPADGFAVVLGEPKLGATTSNLGTLGAGLAARGIPGLVFAFDAYRNAGEPATPYLGIGRGEASKWESPWQVTTGVLPAIAEYGRSLSHAYVFTLKSGHLTVTMDGDQIYQGAVLAPEMAYLYVTAATGDKYEEVMLSDVSLLTSF